MVHAETISRLQGIYLRKSSHNLTRGTSEKAMPDINDNAMLDGVQITPVNEVRFLTQRVNVSRLTSNYS